MFRRKGVFFTERISEELEKRVQERTTELKCAISELEAFSYSVSHDLRAPLRHIDSWCTALEEEYGEILEGNAREYLERIHNATSRMGSLIEDLLSLSRISKQELGIEEVNLTHLAQRIVFGLHETDPQRQIKFLIQPDLVTWGDPSLVEVALTNLLENAFKYTRPCEHVKIELAQIVDGNKKLFYVRDNGVGFDTVCAGDRLFGAFQRFHALSEFPGTGIGLATVRRIVNRHGGEIWAESQVGKGSTFYFNFGDGGQ